MRGKPPKFWWTSKFLLRCKRVGSGSSVVNSDPFLRENVKVFRHVLYKDVGISWVLQQVTLSKIEDDFHDMMDIYFRNYLLQKSYGDQFWVDIFFALLGPPCQSGARNAGGGDDWRWGASPTLMHPTRHRQLPQGDSWDIMSTCNYIYIYRLVIYHKTGQMILNIKLVSFFATDAWKNILLKSNWIISLQFSGGKWQTSLKPPAHAWMS